MAFQPATSASLNDLLAQLSMDLSAFGDDDPAAAGASGTPTSASTPFESAAASPYGSRPPSRVQSSVSSPLPLSPFTVDSSRDGDEDDEAADVVADLTPTAPTPRHLHHAAAPAPSSASAVHFADLDWGDLAGMASELDSMLATGRAPSTKRLSMLFAPTAAAAAVPTSPSAPMLGTADPHAPPVPALPRYTSSPAPPSAATTTFTEPLRTPSLAPRRPLSHSSARADNDDEEDNVPLSRSNSTSRGSAAPRGLGISRGSPYADPAAPPVPALAAGPSEEDEDRPLGTLRRTLSSGGNAAAAASAVLARSKSTSRRDRDRSQDPALSPAERRVKRSGSRKGDSALARSGSSSTKKTKAAGGGVDPSVLVEKLAQAKVQKISTKIFIHDTSRVQPVSVTSITPVGDIVSFLVDHLDLHAAYLDDLDLSPTDLAALAGEVPGWTLFEEFHDLGLERPLRPWEPLGEVLRSWEPTTRNVLVLRRYAFHRAPEFALMGPAAPFCHTLHLESRPGHYKKRAVDLRLGAEAVAYRGTGAEFAAPGTLTSAIEWSQTSAEDVASVFAGRPGSSKPMAPLCSLAHFDVYTITAKRKRQPTAFGIALKNSARMGLFLEQSDHVHYLYADNPDLHRAWVLALRAAKAHVDRFMHREWFEDEPEDDEHDQSQLPLPPADSAADLSGGDFDAAAFDYDAGPSTLVGDISAPTSGIVHGTSITAGPGGKPLLDFSENLAGFTLERPTLLGSSHLSRSRTISGTNNGGGGGSSAAPSPGATLLRRAPSSAGNRMGSSATLGRGGGNAWDSPDAAGSPRYLDDDAFGGGGSPFDEPESSPRRMANAADSDEDDRPLGLAAAAAEGSRTLSRRPTMAAHGSASRSRSKSRTRGPMTLGRANSMPAAPLGAAVSTHDVGGRGTLLDRIEHRRGGGSGGVNGNSGERRGLIDQIPRSRW
ncbi:hypothetical protein H9P43_000606 [Blastocladiella emersonii ATCC 22665]|nr:hypothetical protein H9P43_000606 [Blastocladiella emersonii ATCC 22665]